VGRITIKGKHTVKVEDEHEMRRLVRDENWMVRMRDPHTGRNGGVPHDGTLHYQSARPEVGNGQGRLAISSRPAISGAIALCLLQTTIPNRTGPSVPTKTAGGCP
jgi:hypothetical protein